MIISFNRIELNNFLSYENAEIKLNNNGFVSIKGINLDSSDGAKSNGSGKSALVEAISWSLTGETIRGISNVKRLNSQSDCMVTINFTVDNVEYSVTRSQGSKSNLKLFVAGEDKSGKGIRDTEQILKEYLPDITSQLIGSVILLGQGLPLKLSNNTPSGRKAVLEQLSKSDFMTQDLKAKVQKRSDFLQKNLREIQDSTLLLNRDIEVYKTEKQSAESTLNQLNAYVLPDAELLKNSIDSNKEIITENTNKKNKLKDVENDLQDEHNTKQAERSEKVDEFNASVWKIKEKYQSNIDGLNAELISLKQKLTEINSIKTCCPTCGRPFPDTYKPDSKPVEEEIEKTTSQLLNVQQLLNTELTDYKTVCQEILNQYDVELKDISKRIQDVKSELLTLDNQLTAVTRKVQEDEKTYLNISLEIQHNEEQKKECEQKIKEIEKRISETQENLLYNNKREENIKNRQGIIQKFDTSLKRDFRGILLQNVIRYIDCKAKHFSKIVFGNQNVEFFLDGNNVSIQYNKKEYESLSGGERQKIDLIIQLSLRDMLCRFLNFSSNILVVDELFDNLDDRGCDAVLNLISSELQDVDCIYIITHHTELQLPIDKEIIIQKGTDGISRIIN